MGLPKSKKCHDRHGHFGEVTKSFRNIYIKFIACGANLMKILHMSWQNWEVDETIFSSGASRVTVPDELIEMVQ
jgi:hypothetical protein